MIPILLFSLQILTQLIFLVFDTNLFVLSIYFVAMFLNFELFLIAHKKERIRTETLFAFFLLSGFALLIIRSLNIFQYPIYKESIVNIYLFFNVLALTTEMMITKYSEYKKETTKIRNSVRYIIYLLILECVAILPLFLSKTALGLTRLDLRVVACIIFVGYLLLVFVPKIKNYINVEAV